jgi:anti-anti-sigma factor
VDPQGAPLGLDVHIGDRTATVRLSGELDLFSSEALRTQLDELSATDDVDRIEIDASSVSFVDSAGLHALVQARNEGQAAGIAIRVGAMSDAVQQILDITNLRDVLTS